VSVPLVALPVAKPLPVPEQLVAFVEDHVSVTVLPDDTELLLAESDAVGAVAAFTTIFTDFEELCPVDE